MLSVIIPVYNEENTLEIIVRRLLDLKLDLQIIIVDDGSDDATPLVMDRLANTPKVIALRHNENKGKGSAVITGLTRAQGEITVIQDADLEYDPIDLVTMYHYMTEKKLDVLYGSRILAGSSMSHLRFWLGGRLITFITNLLFKSHITDEPTCYKMIRTPLLKDLKLESTGFEFCPEATAKILKRNIKIPELPVAYYPRKKSEGKKINWRDGYRAVITLLKYKLKK